MTGYVRVDTSNNIADGNVISAADLDNEFDGIQAAFNASTGHNHDGTTGEGAPISVLGPTQDVVVGASTVTPKTTNTVDIGSSSLKFKDLYLAGNASIGGTLAVTGATTLSSALTYGGVTLSNAVTGTGNMVLSASPTFTGTLAAAAANFSGNVTLGDASTDTVTVNGYMGVGGAGNPGRGIQVVSTALTGGDQIGVYSNATASSSATTALRSFYSVPKTAIAAFTCANIYGFSADDASLGAGSSVTNLVGVQIADQTQGTNNYGLRSLVSSGTNKWNIYASGTAQNYFAGNVGIGTTAFANSTLRVSTTDGTYPLGVSGTTKGLRIVTSATDVRLDAVDNTLAASYEPLYLNGSIVKFGTSLTERMRLDSTGLGIGTSSPTNALSVTGSANITGNTTLGDATTDTVTVNGYMAVGGAGGSAAGLWVRNTALTGTNQNGILVSPVGTTSGTSVAAIVTNPGTAASVYTATALYGMYVGDAVKGAGSTITTQNGITIADQTQGVSNIGLTSQVSSGSGKWNIYVTGTADNYFAGRVGFGSTSLGGGSGQYRFSGSITGATTSSGLLYTPTIQSDATANAYVFHSQPSTAAAAFTITNLVHYHATQATIGAGSTVTNQFGFNVQSTLTGATNNYGFYGGIASGTGRWNLYMAGTADNYFAGNVGIGTSSPAAKLDVSASTGAVIRMTSSADGIGAGVTIGDLQFYGNDASVPGAGVKASISAVTNNALGDDADLIFKNSDGTTNNIERMRISYAGNVGIGTSSPAKQLDLAANNTSITTGDPLNTLRFTDTDTTSAAGQPMGRIEWFSSDADTAGVKAYIQAQSTDGSPDADMVFATNHVSGGGTAERMRIQYDGNVGIGTSSPAVKLDVVGAGVFKLDGSGSTTPLILRNNNTASTQLVKLGFDSSGTIKASINAAVYGNDYMTFNVGSDTERMRLDSSGNLGVGTTSPTARIHSNGTIQAVTGSTGIQIYGDGGTGYVNSIGAYPLVFQVNSTERARIDSSGNLLVGTTASGGQSGFAVLKGGSGIETRIEIAHNFGTASGVKYVDFLYATGTIGSITQNGTTAVAYNTSSDYRLKNITGPITTSGAYIDSLNPVEGTWKADGSTFVGLIAHEVQEASRTTVATGVKDGEEMQGMDYSSAELIANMLAELKSLRARVAALESI